MNNGISSKAPEKEQIKSDFECLIRGMNSTGMIDCIAYDDLFDEAMPMFDRMFEQGKKEAITWHPYPEETPQSGDNYLVTVIDQSDHKTRYVGTALFLNVTGWNVSSRYRVIAWANLPEPDSRTVE